MAGRLLGPYDFGAGECRRVLKKLGFPPVPKDANSTGREEGEVTSEAQIRRRTDITVTEKETLINARRGQGAFKDNVRQIEKKCRVTGLRDCKHLRASHIKPWCKSNDGEKLDGFNGLLLSLHVDHLFDEGFISFSDDGDLVVADALHRGVLATWGIPLSINVGKFRSEQTQYLDYHRRHVFRGCED